MHGFGLYGYGMAGHHFFGPIVGLVFWLFFIVAVTLLVIWAIRRSGGHMQHIRFAGPYHPGAPLPGNGHNEAVAIAKRRLASGEITSEQYVEIMRALGE